MIVAGALLAFALAVAGGACLAFGLTLWDEHRQARIVTRALVAIMRLEPRRVGNEDDTLTEPCRRDEPTTRVRR